MSDGTLYCDRHPDCECQTWGDSEGLVFVQPCPVCRTEQELDDRQHSDLIATRAELADLTARYERSQADLLAERQGREAAEGELREAVSILNDCAEVCPNFNRECRMGEFLGTYEARCAALAGKE